MRLWVARPEPGASRTGERLCAQGHAPLVAPVLAVQATGAPLPAGRPDALVVTSANALASLTPAQVADLRGLPLYAVGLGTAAAARTFGLGPVHAGAGDAAALARLLRERFAPGVRLLHLAGAERKAEPAATLLAAGHDLAVHVAYAARALPCLPEPVARALDAPGGLDGALHYSRRSAAVALSLAEAAGRGGAFRALAHYCLSEDVAAPLAAAGVAIHFVAARPREDDLLAGLR